MGLGGPGVQPGLGQPPASQSFGHAPGTPVGLLLRGCSLLPRAPRPVAGPRHGPVPRTDTPRLCSLSRRAGSPRSRRPVGQRGDGGHRRPRSPASCPCPGCRGLRPAGPRSPSEGRRCAERVLGGGTRAGHLAAGARDRVTPVPTSHEQLCVQMRARPSRASGVQEESPRHGAAGGQEGCPVHSAQ